MRETETISKSELSTFIKTYVRTLLEEINKLNERQQAFFEFKQEQPMRCIGIISKSHGVAVVFLPWYKELIEIRQISKRIESIEPISSRAKMNCLY